jgi:hypothetical protein
LTIRETYRQIGEILEYTYDGTTLSLAENELLNRAYHASLDEEGMKEFHLLYQLTVGNTPVLCGE